MRAAELQALAERLGVDLREEHLSIKIDLDAWAPRGKVFRASGCHSIVVESYGKDTYAGARDAMARLLLEGIEDCTEPDCEVCGGEE